jgi:hypothetical protein
MGLSRRLFASNTCCILASHASQGHAYQKNKHLRSQFIYLFIYFQRHASFRDERQRGKGALLFIYLFVCLFIYLFIHSFIRSFIFRGMPLSETSGTEARCAGACQKF